MGQHADRGSTLYEQGRYELALESFIKELAAEPECDFSARMISCCYLALSKPEESLHWAQKAVQFAPESAYGFNVLGRAQYVFASTSRYHNEELPHAAMKAFKRSMELDPALIDNYWLMGEIHVGRADWSAALSWLQKGLAVDPLNPICLCLSGWSRAHLFKVHEGKELLYQSLSISPEYERPLYYLARLALIQGDFETAGKLVQEASRIDPHDVENQDLVCEILKAKSWLYRFALIQYLRLEFVYDSNRVLGQFVVLTLLAISILSLIFCPAITFFCAFCLAAAIPVVLYIWASRTGLLWLHRSKKHYLPEHQKVRLKLLGGVAVFAVLIGLLFLLEYFTEISLSQKLQEARRLEKAGDFRKASETLHNAVSSTGIMSMPKIRGAMATSGLSLSTEPATYSECRRVLVKASFDELLDNLNKSRADDQETKREILNGYAECLRMVGSGKEAEKLE